MLHTLSENGIKVPKPLYQSSDDMEVVNFFVMEYVKVGVDVVRKICEMFNTLCML